MRTALWENHVALGAKMVDFAGYEMPIQYKGIVHEHLTVRNKVGVFDVSHMGRVIIRGEEAGKFIEWLSTNSMKGPGRAVYTCFCDAKGGTVDDAIVYQEDENSFFTILNASRKQDDLNHIREHAVRFNVKIEECFHDEGILALQGPEASKHLSTSLSKPMRFEKQGDLIISTTGYTGSGGYEIFGPTDSIGKLWDRLIAEGVEPIGLGARDTLRLEKGYALYGHELSLDISPLESVSAWTVHREKDFLGKEGVHGKGRFAHGLILADSPIPREGFKVFADDEEVGFVTSGGFSPSLKIPIALILCQRQMASGMPLAVEIRGKRFLGTVTSLPFI